MDPAKHSLSSKGSHVNSGGGNDSLMEDLVQRRGSVNGEKQGDPETREPDVIDGITVETDNHHRGSARKHKSGTVKYQTLGLASQRRTKQKVVSGFTTLSKGPSAGAKPRAALKQVLFSQGVSDKISESQLDVLKQELESYAAPEGLKWSWKEESQGTTLEKSWTDLVQSHATMPKMQKHQQEALWEFVHTELSYINKLVIIKDFVIATLPHLHQRGFLQEVTPKLLFSNLPDILYKHQLFWQEVVFPMLQDVRRTGKPFDPMKLEAGFLQFNERFSVYHNYCWEEEENLQFTSKQMEGNPHFVAFVQWIEAQPQCERMRLGDMQAKPHQRITKYPLLLKAVLKSTLEPHVQQALRGMISSVNSFLESINNYMQLNDEQLALSISAQRVDGYEVEGLNEEIDKHVREISQFDLTCPIRGVGPTIVRKLLLEENLKVRGNKLEVVALLFSDVLLLTKVQKKGERLKVVRPPLALDRTICIPLKDGYSFLLVEVGELQSVMNVIILVASTPESCSTWASNIQQAKETLRTLREQENNRLEHLRVEAKSPTEASTDKIQTEGQLLTSAEGKDQLVNELINHFAINGSEETKQNSPSEKLFAENSQPNPRWGHADINLMHNSDAGQQPTLKPYKKIAMRFERDKDGNRRQEEERFETRKTNEENMMLNHSVQPVPYPDHHNKADLSGHSRTWPDNPLIDELPDVDYPTNEDSTLQQPQPSIFREGFFKSLEREILTGRDSLRRNSDLLAQNIRRNSTSEQSVDMETSSDAWSISKELNSPGLRRRRPSSTNQAPTSHLSKQFLQDSEQTPAVSNSSSNSESDYQPFNMKRNSLPPGFRRQTSHKVLKLGSLKLNQGMFENLQHRVAPDTPVTRTFSDFELPDQTVRNKKPKLKPQRSFSIPNTTVGREHVRPMHSNNMFTSPQAEGKPSSGYNPDHPSPLEGLLKRANVRGKDKVGMKRDKHIMVANLRSRYPPSPSNTPTPSPTANNGGRDTDGEEVGLVRQKVRSVSTRWKEQLVDGDEDDNTSSFVFADGENVDWPGWCFDDKEVMDHLSPRDEGLSRSFADCGLGELSEQEDGECSQV